MASQVNTDGSPQLQPTTTKQNLQSRAAIVSAAIPGATCCLPAPGLQHYGSFYSLQTGGDLICCRRLSVSLPAEAEPLELGKRPPSLLKHSRVMDPLVNMTSLKSPCSGAAVHDDEDIAVATTSGAQPEGTELARRRRHSFFIPRRKSIVSHIMDGEEHLLLKVSFEAVVVVAVARVFRFVLFGYTSPTTPEHRTKRKMTDMYFVTPNSG